jgi:tetratricopeptide (TPR) repeat protein
MKRIAVLLAVAFCAGCAGDDALAVLERARALHREAVARAARGDLGGAVRALEEVAQIRFTEGAPEAEDVAIDALAEASRLLLGASRPEEAEKMARGAVARASRESYFLGLAWLRLGDALRARGREREAVGAFERSIAVNRGVMDRLSRTEPSR